MNSATVVGSLAAALSVASFAPQAWRIIKTREIKGLSAKTYSLTAMGFALWTIFGFMKQEWPIIVPNLLCLLFALFILAMLLMPDKNRNKVADTLDPNRS